MLVNLLINILVAFIYLFTFFFKLNSYRDFKEDYDSPNAYQYTKTYFYVLVARLAFLVCFEVRENKFK